MRPLRTIGACLLWWMLLVPCHRGTASIQKSLELIKLQIKGDSALVFNSCSVATTRAILYICIFFLFSVIFSSNKSKQTECARFYVKPWKLKTRRGCNPHRWRSPHPRENVIDLQQTYLACRFKRVPIFQKKNMYNKKKSAIGSDFTGFERKMTIVYHF